MHDFLFYALPGILMGSALAVYFYYADKVQKRRIQQTRRQLQEPQKEPRDKTKKHQEEIYPAFGMCFGVCLGISLSSAGLFPPGIGISAGMWVGLLTGLLIPHK